MHFIYDRKSKRIEMVQEQKKHENPEKKSFILKLDNSSNLKKKRIPKNTHQT